MAHAGSIDWTHNGFEVKGSLCNRCGYDGASHHQHYYPTFMNGDAETIAALCDGCWKMKKWESYFAELPRKQRQIIIDILVEKIKDGTIHTFAASKAKK